MKIFNSTLINKLNFEIIFISLLIFNVFYWGSFLNDFYTRFYILLFVLYYIYNFKITFLNKKKELYFVFFSFLFLIIHYFLSFFLIKDILDININISSIIKILVFCLLLFIFVSNFDLIKKNILKISIYFLISIAFFFVIEFFINLDLFLWEIYRYFLNIPCYQGFFILTNSFFFSEQSHFAMIVVGPLIILLNYISNNILNWKYIFLFIIINLIIFLNLSVTFLATLFCITLISLFLNFSKNFKKNLLIYFLFFITISLMMPRCGIKLVYLIKQLNFLQKPEYIYIGDKILSVEHYYRYLMKLKGYNFSNKSKYSFEDQIKIQEENVAAIKLAKKSLDNVLTFKQKPKEKLNNLGTRISLSNAVYKRAFEITIFDLNNFLIGVGFDNYKYKFKYFYSEKEKQNPGLLRKEDPQLYKALLLLNIEDASNNFFKILTEFGVIGALLIIIILLFFLKNSKINSEVKIFILCFFISQTFFRGAGYFNGGYIFAISIMLYSLIYNKNA